ncbi:hypothetical protein JCM16303_000271 [Sporobolomyces ruberrimus]
MIDPVGLFNDAQLSVVVPSLSSSSPPVPSSLSPSPNSATTDEWIQGLLESKQRTTTYYDESLEYYLVVTLASTASSSLSRTQAHSFFLQSLPQPHLTLATSISYYEGAPARPPPTSRTHSALSAGSSLTDLRPATHDRYPNPPLDPTTTRESVLVSTKRFKQEEDGEEEEKELKVWVGQTWEGNWVGVWQFNSILPFVQTSFYEAKLAITITVSFRDDPKLDRILSFHNKETNANGSSEATEAQNAQEEEDDEYMDDSYDDVNLLSSLGTSQSFHLPFSRLPTPFLPPLSTNAPLPSSHSRRHSRSRSLTSSEPHSSLSDPSQSPLIRRSILKTFDLSKPIQVSIRTIDCTIPDPDNSQIRSEGQDLARGMTLLLELVGPRGIDRVFVVDEIRVGANSKGNGGAASTVMTSNDLEVKRVAPVREGGENEAENVRLGENDQFNLVYRLSLSPSSQLLQDQQTKLQHSAAGNSVEGGVGIAIRGEGISSVPIGVATSPSQRFTARFGSVDEEGGNDGYEEDVVDWRKERERERERKKREEMFRRNVKVIVRGRILVKKEKEESVSGYTVEEVAGQVVGTRGAVGSDEEEAWTFPTREISSRWNYMIDISSFAHQPPPLLAEFRSTTGAPRPTSIAGPRISLLPPSSIRPVSTLTASNAARTEIESIAGSKRHTMASLASLSLKSPVLGRKASLAPQPPSRPNPTVPRRFFSLPPSSQENISTPTGTTPMNGSYFAGPRQTETPPPMNPVSPAVARNSLPLASAAQQNSEASRRTTWMSGLGIGKSNSMTPEAGRTSWDSSGGDTGGPPPPRENGLGLALDGTGSNSPLPPLPPQSSLPPRPSEIDNPSYREYNPPAQNGRILVTVSLVPLRTVKSRRLPQLNGIHSDSDSLPAATLPGLTTSTSSTLSPPASYHASFSFPPTSSTPTSPRSPSPLSSPNLDTNEASSGPSSFAERTALLTSQMPRVGLLDVFLVQLFVVNQTDQVKRFVVGVPPARIDNGRGDDLRETGSIGGRPRGETLGVGSLGDRREGAKRSLGPKEEFATLVPLENDVRIGPLAPNSCASLGLRMLAISPGAHVLDELKLVDLADGSETRLRNPLWVVVE